MKTQNKTHNSLKTRVFSIVLAILTVLVNILSPFGNSGKVQAAPDYPDEILIDIDMAQESLQELLEQKELFALVYLCDIFEIKSSPDMQSDTVVSVDCGQAVQIIGVDQDESYEIWFQVRAAVGDNLCEGYILRENLAYSDEDLLNWELDQIMTLSFCLFSLTSAEEEAEETDSLYKDVQAFPLSYQQALLTLKEQHPNWIFVPLRTGLNWNQAVLAENSQDRSLLHSSQASHLLTGIFKQDPAWSYPTNGVLAYYLDPRNFLTENYIFQFEFLSYNQNYHTEAAVQGILQGTFMDHTLHGAIPGDESNRTYAQAFCQIAQELKVSPFHLASRVRQEQGVGGTSSLISGTYKTETVDYCGVYNYFNIGASSNGQGGSKDIEAGLKKAQEMGWTTRYLSLRGGANIITQNYIQKGQNTLYLQKFNVNRASANGVYKHQYMQNIKAPSDEATSIRKAYATTGCLDCPFVFSIPVYEDMPVHACSKPQAAKELHLAQDSFTLKADETAAQSFCLDGLVLNAASASLTFTSSDETVATVSPEGIITAGNAGTATITCTAPGNISAVCTVTVSKAAPAVTVPVPDAVTYAPKQTLQDISLPEGWSWDNPSIVPTVENVGYPATYTPANPDKYESVKATVSLTVKKGIPTYELPKDLTIAEGNPLASLKLPAGFFWDDDSVILTKTGEYSAHYNPDEANYETITDIQIPVTVTVKDNTCKQHVYGEWIITTKATCETCGEQEHYCKNCGDRQTESIPALTHQYRSEITKEPTEEETGIRTFTCEFCKDSYTETIDKLPESHKHSYHMEITRQATCTEKGLKTFTCSCKDSFTEDIAALGHTYQSTVTKEPTETAEGIRTYTCTRCQDSYTEVIAKLPASHKHSYTETITKQATCTEKGLKTFSCSCKDTYTEEIPALGHDMADGRCRRCGYTESTTPATPSAPETTPAPATPAAPSTPAASETTPAATAPDAPAAPETTPAATTSATTTTPETTQETAPTATTSATSTTPDTTQAATTTVESQPGPMVATLNMKNNTVLYEETLAAVRGHDVEIVLQMSDQVSWTIQGNNILADEANGVDMGVLVNADVIPAEIMNQASKLSETGNVIELSLAHDGPLDFKPVLTVDTNKANAGRMATLFYFNPESGELEFMDEVEISENGSISFTFEHASDYAVVISEKGLSNYRAITATGAVETGNEASEILPVASMEKDAESDSTDSGNKRFGGMSSTTLLFLVGALLFVIVLGIGMVLISRRKLARNDWEEGSFESEDESDSSEYSADIPEDDYDYDYDDENGDYDSDFADDYRDPVCPDCEESPDQKES